MQLVISVNLDAYNIMFILAYLYIWYKLTKSLGNGCFLCILFGSNQVCLEGSQTLSGEGEGK